jgi:hypothetical protein
MRYGFLEGQQIGGKCRRLPRILAERKRVLEDIASTELFDSENAKRPDWMTSLLRRFWFGSYWHTV